MNRGIIAATALAVVLAVSGNAGAAYDVQTIATGDQFMIPTVVDAFVSPAGIALIALTSGISTATPGSHPSAIDQWPDDVRANAVVIKFFPNDDAIVAIRTIAGAQVQYRRADGTWVGSPQIISVNSFGNHVFDVAIDASGAAIFVAGRGDGRIRVFKRAASAETNQFDTGVFESLELDGQTPTDVFAAIDPDGSADVVYVRGGILKQATRAGAAAFTAATVLDAGPVERLVMASNATGRAAAVWHRTGAQFVGDWRGGVRAPAGAMADGGVNLTGTSGGDQFAAIAMNEDGRVAAAVGLIYAQTSCMVGNSGYLSNDTSVRFYVVRAGETLFRPGGDLDDASVGNIVARGDATSITWRVGRPLPDLPEQRVQRRHRGLLRRVAEEPGVARPDRGGTYATGRNRRMRQGDCDGRHHRRHPRLGDVHAVFGGR